MGERVELELALAGDGQGGYQVTVRSGAGDRTGRFDLDPWPVLKQRPQLQSTVLASAVSSRGALSEVERPVREVGEALFNALFDEGVYAAYQACCAVATERGTQLRVVLRTQTPELAALPWEMLYDPEAGAYLCQREPLVRHVSVPSVTRPLRVSPPLRILGVVAAPRDRARLDVEGEKQRLSTALAPLGSRVELRWVDGGRWADVQEELVAGSWHVLHFVGHGGFDREGGGGILALEDDEGNTDIVGAERFSDLLTLQSPPLQLVVLNSCAGGHSAAQDLFSSTAATLIRTGVSAVVAMQFAVSDPAAKAFAAGFYQAIAHNHSIAEAVRVGRIGIRGTSEETLEWITPVLYLRGDDAPLFDVLPTAPEQQDEGAQLTPLGAAEEAAVQALYQQAMSRFRGRRFGEAVALFDSLLSVRADYRDATARREQAANEVRVTEAYDDATAAETRGDWTKAVEGYAAVLALAPHRAGVQEKLDAARRQQKIADLQAELREHQAADDWPAALVVAEELERLSPGITGLVDHQPSDTGDGQVAVPSRGPGDADAEVVSPEPAQPERKQAPRWTRSALGAVVTGLFVGGGVWALINLLGDSPPAPFESEDLYELARHHFTPEDCTVPQSQEEAVRAWTLPHTELLKCQRPDDAYTGALLCAENETDFLEIRDAYLDAAVDAQPAEAVPAGRDESWPFQRAFQHTGSGAARVYWDDPGSLCAVELQVTSTDVSVALDHFTSGLDS